MPSRIAQTTVDRDRTAWTATDLQTDPHTAPDKAQRVQTMFAAIARWYDLNNRLHSFGRDQAWRRTAVRLANVQPTDSVLDVACGTGDLTLAFAAAQPAPRLVVGVDFTKNMLAIADEKATRRIATRSRFLHPPATVIAPSFIHGDAMNLAFCDSSFDIVSIAFGIRNVSDPARALREFYRVLRPGGRLVVLEFSKPTHRIIRWLNDVYAGIIMPRTASWIAWDLSGAYRYLPKSVATFPEGKEFINLLATCGFTQITAHPMTLGVCTAYLARRQNGQH